MVVGFVGHDPYWNFSSVTIFSQHQPVMIADGYRNNGAVVVHALSAVTCIWRAMVYDRLQDRECF